MLSDVQSLVAFIHQYKRENPTADKAEIKEATVEVKKLRITRSVCQSSTYSVRFSEATGTSFSNVVLSLSALARLDDKPLVVCVVRPCEVEFLLANSTFLKKISHSSHMLRLDNIKGSFLGHDIVREYAGLANVPDNFEELFALHDEIPWEENLQRLVEATLAISGTGAPYTPSGEEIERILEAPKLTSAVVKLDAYREIESQLKEIVAKHTEKILTAAAIDNINIRGNRIEQIISSGTNIHSVNDVMFKIGSELTLHVDIKTKLVHKCSAPKAYNVDKVLRLLGTGRDLVAFFFVGIDVIDRKIYCRLVSIFDRMILSATRLQFHWAGRNSRGVTQLGGNIHSIFHDDFEEEIVEPAATQFLLQLMKG